MRGRGVAVQDVDGAERVERVADECGDALLVTEVEAGGDYIVAGRDEVLCLPVSTFVFEVGDDHAAREPAGRDLVVRRSLGVLCRARGDVQDPAGVAPVHARQHWAR